jgi:hypothetical protein
VRYQQEQELFAVPEELKVGPGERLEGSGPASGPPACGWQRGSESHLGSAARPPLQRPAPRPALPYVPLTTATTATLPPAQASLQQEVVLPGLITGLTEVPLSVAQKMRNIEETEALKTRLLASKKAGREDDGGGELGMQARRGQFAFAFGRGSSKAKAKGGERQQPLKVIKDPAVRRYGARAAGPARE